MKREMEAGRLSQEHVSFATLTSFLDSCSVSKGKIIPNKGPVDIWRKPYFLDSGAFSAHSRNLKIDLDSYIDFCKEYEREVDIYASLDVIGDPQTSLKNYLKMREAGLKPMPTVHAGTDYKYLDLYAKHTDRIGLGGVAKMNASLRETFIHGAFSRYPDPKEIKFHGFGISNPATVKKFPWSSCDSTVSGITSKNGYLIGPNGRYIHINQVPLQQEYFEKSLKKRNLPLYFLEKASEDGPIGITYRYILSTHLYIKNIYPETDYYEPLNRPIAL